MSRLRVVGAVAGLWTLVLTTPSSLMGQGSSEGARFQATCTGGDPSAALVCGQAAGSALGTGLSLTLLSTGGSLAPVPPSTMGMRLPDGGPRVAFSVRVSRIPLRAVAMSSTPAASSGIEEGSWSVRMTGASGVFDGFRPIPSVGGVLSLDVFATLDRLVLPPRLTNQGAWSGSAGVRVGLIRESFTAPGVSLDLALARTQEIDLVDAANAPVSAVQSRTRAARLSVGKDLGGLGLVAGAGRNWIDLPTRFFVGANGRGELSTTRDVLFGGVTLNFLVVQLNGEVGWAGGSEVDALSDPLVDTGGDDLFGTVTVRLVF